MANQLYYSDGTQWLPVDAAPSPDGGGGATIVYIPHGGTAADVPAGTPTDALIIERGA